MAGKQFSFALLGMVSVLLLAAVLPSFASPVSDSGTTQEAWPPSPNDWTMFRNNAARNGVTEANASMKFLYLKWSYKTGGSRVSSSPAVADVDNDKWPEVLIGSEDSRLYCLNASSGRLEWRFQTQGLIFSSPAIGDINGDGYAEVLVGSNDGRLYAINGSKGSLLWQYAFRGGVYSSPVMADVNGDGALDVVVASYDGEVAAFHGNGSRIWRTRFTLQSTDIGIQSSPAVGDLLGDGWPDVVLAAGDDVLMFNGTTGKIDHSISTFGDKEHIQTTPVIYDLTGNGRPEIIFTTTNDPTIWVVNDKLNSSYGLKEKNWVRILSSPSVADGDGDGFNEAYFGTDAGTFECMHLGLDDNFEGSIKRDWTAIVAAPIRSSPALADLDGDGKLEAVFGCDNRRVYIINAEAPRVAMQHILPKAIFSSPAVADGDMDGKAEVYLGCYDGGIYALDYNF